MCYSAKVVQKWRTFRRETGVRMDLPEFHRIYHLRDDAEDIAARIPRGFDLEFSEPDNAEERRILELILAFRKRKSQGLESALFSQRKRLADAERKLQSKETKAAVESKRIASSKVQQYLGKMALLRDDEPRSGDYRIYPLSYAPVLVNRGGELVLTPARYQLRPPGKPAAIDRQLSLFNSRRDNLTGAFWRPLFGTSHAILPAHAFYENVSDAAGKNHVLEFMPGDHGTMWIACLFARWEDPQDPAKYLQSFAAVTDDPPQEVAAAGHDRVPVNLTWHAAQAWLTPEGRSDAEILALMDEGRQRPIYEHRAAA